MFRWVRSQHRKSTEPSYLINLSERRTPFLRGAARPGLKPRVYRAHPRPIFLRRFRHGSRPGRDKFRRALPVDSEGEWDQGAMIPAIVLAFESSHDPSTTLGMTGGGTARRRRKRAQPRMAVPQGQSDGRQSEERFLPERRGMARRQKRDGALKGAATQRGRAAPPVRRAQHAVPLQRKRGNAPFVPCPPRRASGRQAKPWRASGARSNNETNSQPFSFLVSRCI